MSRENDFLSDSILFKDQVVKSYKDNVQKMLYISSKIRGSVHSVSDYRNFPVGSQPNVVMSDGGPEVALPELNEIDMRCGKVELQCKCQSSLVEVKHMGEYVGARRCCPLSVNNELSLSMRPVAHYGAMTRINKTCVLGSM